MPRIPKNAEYAMNALNNVAANRYSPVDEKTKNIRVLSKRITSLEKRSRKWAILVTLLAAGSLGVALWYVKYTGLPITAQQVKDYAKAASGVIKSSSSTYAAKIKNKARTVRNAVGKIASKYKAAPIPLLRKSMYNRGKSIFGY